MARLTDSIVNYVQESFQELKRVTWPTRNQAVRLTFIVLGFCIVAAAALGVFDFGFNYGYHSLVDYAAKIAPPAATEIKPEDIEVGTEESQPKTTEKTASPVNSLPSSAKPSKNASQQNK